MNVYQKLQKARTQLQSIKLNKSGHNKFAGYSYFELGDFLPTVQQIFNEIGLCGVVSFGEKYADLVIVNTENPDEKIVFTSPMEKAELKGCHPIQNLGAVETYQRRYLWVSAMEIVEHDALDSSEPIKDKKLNHKPVAVDVWETLPSDEKEFLQGIAMEVIGAPSFEQAAEILTKANLDPDEKTAIWSRFDSKLRAGIKSVQTKKESVNA